MGDKDWKAVSSRLGPPTITLYSTAVVTPIFNGERVRIPVSFEDYRLVGEMPRAPGNSVVIRDVRDGRVYRLDSAPCNFPKCYCGAIATELIDGR